MGGSIVNPQNTTEDIAGIVSTATDTVVERFSQAAELADDSMKTALQFLNDLKNAADSAGFFIPDIEPLFPAPISPYFNPGDPPVEPLVELFLPEFPIMPILQTISLVTGIQARLESDLASGGTGLNPAVEMEIWRREEERSRIALDDAKEKVAAEWSKRGFALPDGVLAANLQQVETEYMNKRVDLSRTIAIKQYEAAFENTKFIIQQVLAMEQVLIGAISEGNKSLIEGYKADMEGYRSKVQAAVERMGAYIKKYEAGGSVYRAKAEAQSSIAMVDVKAFEASINSAIAQMNLYLKQAELQMGSIDAMARIRVAAADAGGRIAAQLAAGAMSGVYVQAHISAGASATKTYSGQEQLSESYPHTERP